MTIGLGEKVFETFLNFESEEVLLEFDMHPNEAYREDLVYLANSVSEKMGINPDLAYPMDGNRQTLESKMNWDNLAKKYPKLFKVYQHKLK